MVELYSYKVFFNVEDDCYIATCLELGGMSAHGASDVDAFKEIKRATLHALECLYNDGDEFPEVLPK